jgi:K+-sensing histidine kinase KdpD
LQENLEIPALPPESVLIERPLIFKWQQVNGSALRDGPLAYGLAAALVALAFLLRLLLDPLWGDRLPFVSFFVACFVVAQFAEAGPSVFASVAGFLLAVWFFMPARHTLWVHGRVEQVNSVFYFVLCFSFAWLSLRMRRALHRERQAKRERERLVSELQAALREVKTLSGLLPICTHCKKIRDDKGYWSQIELYIRDHSNADFTHGICPECAARFLRDLPKDDLNNP